ncbi:MAG: class I SAM-dependent methyltransferase [Kiritimatiellia bacterium]|nr:class I SAM-dependent methyltransferase [Lentisphaerota bacterium]
MKSSEIQRMSRMEDFYWWHLGRNAIVRELLKSLHLSPGSRIINIGCGTGGMIPVLQEFGAVDSYDPSSEAVQICRERGLLSTNLFDGMRLPCPDGAYDLAVALDVLEHIEDDEAALDEWKRVLKPGGRMLLTVPAYQWLWSSHDEALGHFRRYSASQLHRKLNRLGLSVGKRSYAITFSFPLIMAYRLFDSLRQSDHSPAASYVMLPRPLNAFLAALLSLEGRILRHVNFPFGTSVVIIGRKNI